MEQAIATIRTFNRFFTRHVGAIDARFLDSDANLPEARLLFEIARLEPVLASTLQAELDLDRGYLSRMIVRFEKKDWIVRDQQAADARARPIRLTTAGRAAFDQIDENGNCTKPFLLPQKNPKEFYDNFFFSYNVPDFTSRKVELDMRQFANDIYHKQRIQVTTRRN